MYRKYSDFLKNKYGEKVYKLPINLPVTCPNREESSGCTFCSECGTGFESRMASMSVSEQLSQNQTYIGKKYNARKFIAYFQNYTNTYLTPEQLEYYLNQTLDTHGLVGISISTRPDCVSTEQLELLSSFSRKNHLDMELELGLQTANYHTLKKINRGHGLAEFLDCVLRIDKYNISVGVHIILNLPYDTAEDAVETSKILSVLPVDIVKIHSLYIAKNTLMARDYLEKKFLICTKDEYIERLILFLEYLRDDIVIERLFARAPKDETIFCNWNTSWWKLKEEFEKKMLSKRSYQGRLYHYIDGCALKKGRL